MVKVKNGVTPRNLYIFAAAANVAQLLNLEVVVTAGTDGKHMTGSKHYEGAALDFRTSNLSNDELKTFTSQLKSRLGSGYDIVTEDDHLHVEYDPK
jgi:uncharacterized protein YcbK (DUF882 family)